jgi:prolyl 4-hydroxylase
MPSRGARAGMQAHGTSPFDRRAHIARRPNQRMRRLTGFSPSCGIVAFNPVGDKNGARVVAYPIGAAVAKPLLSDHIIVFDDVLSAETCRELIARFEASPEKEDVRRECGYSFTQINVTQHWPDQHKTLVPAFLSCLNRYQLAVNARFWPPQFCFEHLRLKRYLPDGGDFFGLHVDVMGQAAARRFMTAILYLNSVEGGETVFPELDVAVAPAPGKLVAFPPLWLFPHAGLSPRSDPKYILHTYLCYPV